MRVVSSEPEIGATSYSFTVTYSDNGSVDASSIDAGDVTVNGIAMDTGVAGGGDGSPLTATYTFTPPGGDWDDGDNGTFDIQVGADEVGRRLVGGHVRRLGAILVLTGAMTVGGGGAAAFGPGPQDDVPIAERLRVAMGVPSISLTLN